ncbi:MAG: RagB/SusD family nutrient uptake outer membrane protein [Phocaeicola sp.]
MKLNTIKHLTLATLLSFGTVSCENFLNRPTEDNYNESNFYLNDEQCFQGVNYLYTSPWYDFQRGFIKMGEVLSGNYFWGSSPYLTFTVNGTNEDLINMSYSLWAVNGHANTVYNRLKTASASQATINTCMGECLTWKAMAYFYLVRSFGAVPIIHDNSDELANNSYNDKYKVESADVYEYIVMTLEKAIELLPARGETGRIDQAAAKGLLAKVYLTRSGLGLSGTRNQSDLDQAAKYAKEVIDQSGRNLLTTYSDIFRLENNKNEECLLSWHWYPTRDPWTAQNTLQSDLGMKGFSEFGDCWGEWNGPSVDLQDAFGVSALGNPSGRYDTDSRRQATMMMIGDKYTYFWQDKNGFDYLKFLYDDSYGAGGPGEMSSPTGSNAVKHLFGNANDHIKGLGISAGNMLSGLSTHILRLADIYLVYAEAKIGNSGTTTDASAIDAFYKVRSRAVSTYERPASISWEDVWKERRLEMACEGDRWFDYVRLSYYNPQRAIDELKGQRRDVYYGLSALYKKYYEDGSFDVNPSDHRYNDSPVIPNVTQSSFALPFPTEDVVFNPNLMKDPIHVDVRSTFSY